MTEHEPQDPPDPHEVLRKFELRLDDVQRHVMLPDHIREAKEWLEPLSLGPPVRVKTGLAAALASAFALFYTLNVEKLGRDLHDLLSPCLMGYALELRQSGAAVLTQQWRWAKSYADGLTGFGTDTLLHLASVSKLITAMAMTKLLDERGISYDAAEGNGACDPCKLAALRAGHWIHGLGRKSNPGQYRALVRQRTADYMVCQLRRTADC